MLWSGRRRWRRWTSVIESRVTGHTYPRQNDAVHPERPERMRSNIQFSVMKSANESNRNENVLQSSGSRSGHWEALRFLIRRLFLNISLLSPGCLLSRVSSWSDEGRSHPREHLTPRVYLLKLTLLSVEKHASMQLWTKSHPTQFTLRFLLWLRDEPFSCSTSDGK